MRRKKKHDEIDGRWVEEPTRVKGELKKKKKKIQRGGMRKTLLGGGKVLRD